MSKRDGRFLQRKSVISAIPSGEREERVDLTLELFQSTYVSQSQLAALMWNHGPEMWGRMAARKIPLQKMEKKEMADLFAFLYFIRYMDEPGDPQKGKLLMETKACIKCHTVKEGTKGDLSRWGMYTNPIVWAQMMWNHAPQMEQEMKKKGLSRVEFKGKEMIDLIAYIRSINPKAEKAYLSPGDPQSGEKLFTTKKLYSVSCTWGRDGFIKENKISPEP